MKKTFKTLLVITALIFALSLVSCGDKSGAPDGMQLARGGEEYGYNFYVPEEWVISCYGDFATAYVSAVNNSSVTFAEAAMPCYGLDEDGFTSDDAKSYFTNHINNVEYIKNSKEFTVFGDRCTFGNESNAYKFIYTYDYPKENGQLIHYRAMQIVIARGDRLYLFQYNSQNAVPEYSTDGTTYYELYLEKVNEIIASFKFLTTPSTRVPAVAGSVGDLVLVSDYKICGFDFYAPSDSLAIASSSLVHRDLGGGSSVSIAELVSNTTSSNPDEYWAGILANMEKSFGTVTQINVQEKDKNALDLKGATWARFYEYEYEYASVTYSGYTVIIQTGTNLLNAKAYMFNYTAEAGAFKEGLLQEMLNRVEFK